ncbi:snake venom vascular endothelial growth factor toxin vammin-like isoform X2 [Eublepharis macularius]|uniref:Snake venom vascular endothelial growth factor toxin vammin-like isoform X2 n=1 Tax=Eublepharis macularius TaxID=481883 RepID=A0AA97LHP6_EUBMA|nr:snake venom vascular endothelial growth factor toxin vammin-like isoform X2 [Eublepharis macularius]
MRKEAPPLPSRGPGKPAGPSPPLPAMPRPSSSLPLPGTLRLSFAAGLRGKRVGRGTALLLRACALLSEPSPGWRMRAAGHLLAAALLGCALGPQRAPSSDPATGVVPFEEVWSRSYCRARETLVDVLSEFPHQAEHIFKPPCVPLRRCAGCCGDESLECAPVETRRVDLQVVQVSPTLGTTQEAELTFLEHTQCVCRPRRKRLKNERHHRIGAKRRPREPSLMPSTPLCKVPPVERPGDQSQSPEQVLGPSAASTGTCS